MSISSVALKLVVFLVFVFLLSPIFVIIPSSFTTTSYATFPPEGFTLRWFESVGQFQDIISSIGVSMIIATAVTVFTLLVAIPAAFAIVRGDFRGRDILNTVFGLPLSVPWIILGIALLLFYSQLIRLGPDTMQGIAAGQVIVTTPFALRILTTSLTGLDRSLEEASMSLGAGRLRTIFRVTFPLIKSGLISCVIFVFMLSFNDLTIALFLGGPTVAPFPVALYKYLILGNFDPIITALVSLIIMAQVILSVALGRFFKGYAPSLKE